MEKDIPEDLSRLSIADDAQQPLIPNTSSKGHCKYGRKCSKILCPYLHPQGRFMDSKMIFGRTKKVIVWDDNILSVYHSGGLIALARRHAPYTSNGEAEELVALLIVEVRKYQGLCLGIPGGLRDRPDKSPYVTAIREFCEETRGIFDHLKDEIHEQLVENFPNNLVYSADGGYVCSFAEIPYMHDAHTVFKTSGKKVEDETLGLLWVPVQDLMTGNVKVPFKNSKVDLPTVPLAGLLHKLTQFHLWQEALRATVDRINSSPGYITTDKN